MLETEVKAKINISVNQLQIKIEQLGYQFRNKTLETDHYFFIIENGEPLKDAALRIRVSKNGDEENTFLAYKGPKVLQTRQEIEFGIANASDAKSFLLALGHQKALTVCKSRLYYQKGRIIIAVDSVDELGDFIELEILSANSDDMREDAKELLLELSKILPGASTIEKSYLHLLMEKK